MKLILGQRAYKDIQNIIDYTNIIYDEDQADIYISSIKKTFERIGIFPEIGTKNIIDGILLFAFPVRKHIIFYSIEPNFIKVVRIVHHLENIR